MLEKICDSSGMGGSPATVCFTLALVGMAGCFTEGINCDCGDGASFRRGECVADLTCGPGTTLQDGECLLDSDGVVCDGQLEVSEDGRRCVPSDGACEPPAILDQMSGRCVSPGEIVCGIGTEPNGNLCVPSCDGDFEISNAQRTGCEPAARIQFVHASADPSITSGFDSSVNGAAIELGLAVLPNLREDSTNPDHAQLAFVHAVSDAEPISVSVVQNPSDVEIFDSAFASSAALAYTNDSDGTPLPPLGVSQLRFVAGDGSLLDRDRQTSTATVFPPGTGLTASTVGVLVATGFAAPDSNLGGGADPGAPFEVVVVLPDGTSELLDVVAP